MLDKARFPSTFNESIMRFLASALLFSPKKYEKLMEGYHDLVDYGRREIYKIEG